MIAQFEQMMQRLIEFNLLTDDEEERYSDFMLYIEQNLRWDTEYIKFIKLFNVITGKKYKPDNQSRALYYEHAPFYTLNDRKLAITNALKDPYLQQKDGVLNPKFICKAENIAKYIKYSPPITNTTVKNEPDQFRYDQI